MVWNLAYFCFMHSYLNYFSLAVLITHFFISLLQNIKYDFGNIFSNKCIIVTSVAGLRSKRVLKEISEIFKSIL